MGRERRARNWVRLLPGDRVEVELGEHDLTRADSKKIGKAKAEGSVERDWKKIYESSSVS